MLNSCGPALSQGDGGDFHPRCNWEATPPGHSGLPESLEKIGQGAAPAQTYYGSPVELEEYGNAGRCS